MVVPLVNRWQKKIKLRQWRSKVFSLTGYLWRKICQHPISSIGVIVTIIVIVVVILSLCWWGWDWTGLTGYSLPTPQYQRGKTLWDWLQLLFVPLVLAFGISWFNQRQNITALSIAEESRNEEALQTYFTIMSDLVMEKNLHQSKEGDPVRLIARTRTLTILRRLDPVRKASVIQFLYELDLLDRDDCIVDISGADLSSAELILVDLSHTQLNSVLFCNADLSFANLYSTSLTDCDFSGADLGAANLEKTDLDGILFRNTHFGGASLKKSIITGFVDFSDAEIGNADFGGSEITATIIGGLEVETKIEESRSRYEESWYGRHTDERLGKNHIP